MASTVIINSGVSNIDSITRAIEHCDGRPLVTDDPKQLAAADRVILPGVGSFAAAMRALQDKGLGDALSELLARREIPFLGVCLGMQLMASRSFEHGVTEGLSLISGEVLPLSAVAADERVPHIGWNTVEDCADCLLLKGLPPGSDFYFVHGYHFKPTEPRHCLAQTPSYGGIAAIVGEGLRYGTQFHPEKSQAAGFALLKNFLAL